ARRGEPEPDQAAAPPPDTPPAHEEAPPPPPPPPAAAPAPAAAQAPTTPWQWSVGLVRVWDSLLHVISPDATFDVGCTLKATNVRSEGEDPAAIALQLMVGDGGTITVDGKTHIQPVGFDGSVKAEHVPLPDIVATVGAFPPGVVQSALLHTDPGIPPGALGPPPGDVVVKGTIAFDDAQLAGAGGPTTEFGAKRLEFGLGELVLPGALPASGPPATADARLTGGTVTLKDMRVARTEPTKIDLHAGSIDAGLDQVTLPGVGPPPPDGGKLQLRGKLAVGDLMVGDAGGSGMDLGMRKIDFATDDFVLPGLLAKEPAKVSAPLRLSKARLSVDDPRVTGTPKAKLNAVAQGFDVTIGELLVPGAMGGVPGDVRLRDARFTLAQPRIDDDRTGRLDVQARNIDVSLNDLVVPGPGAPGFGSGALQLRGQLPLAEPAVAGADPKEFAIGARSIMVGIDQFAAPGSGAVPTRLSLGEVTLASPRVQVTRAAEGILLPFGAATAPPPPTPTRELAPPPTPAPAATKPAIVPPPPPSVPAASSAPPPGIEVDVDRFRLTDGKVVVTDRTVKPFYSGGLAPLDIDVTRLRWPVLAANQLRVAATSAQKGKIVIT